MALSARTRYPHVPVTNARQRTGTGIGKQIAALTVTNSGNEFEKPTSVCVPGVFGVPGKNGQNRTEMTAAACVRWRNGNSGFIDNTVCSLLAQRSCRVRGPIANRFVSYRLGTVYVSTFSFRSISVRNNDRTANIWFYTRPRSLRPDIDHRCWLKMPSFSRALIVYEMSTQI